MYSTTSLCDYWVLPRNWCERECFTEKPCDLLASRLLKSLIFWMKDADFSANASRFFVFVWNLLATKAIARRFSVQRHIPHCFQFHLATTCNLHQLFARRLRNTQFSLVTSILVLVLVYYIVTRVLLTSLQACSLFGSDYQKSVGNIYFYVTTSGCQMVSYWFLGLC